MLSLSVFSSRTEFRNVLPIVLSTFLKVTVFFSEKTVGKYYWLTAVSLLHKSPMTQTLCDVGFDPRTAVAVLSPVKHAH